MAPDDADGVNDPELDAALVPDALARMDPPNAPSPDTSNTTIAMRALMAGLKVTVNAADAPTAAEKIV